MCAGSGNWWEHRCAKHTAALGSCTNEWGIESGRGRYTCESERGLAHLMTWVTNPSPGCHIHS